MKRQELWRQQYRLRRYMEYLTECDLQQRARDVFNNLLLLNNEARIGLPPVHPQSEAWMILWSDVLEEFAIRYGPYSAGFTPGFVNEVGVPDPQNPLAARAANAVRNTSLPDGEYLFKYGKAEHLRRSIETGVIRVSPGASYADPSLNPAMRDQELELSVYSLPADVKMTAYCGKTGAFKGEISPTGNVRWTSQSRTNFYVYCLSVSFAPRLFLDFDADACIVIRNPLKFSEALLTSIENIMHEWRGCANDVSYIDPLNCPTSEIDVFFSKHFRYSYQKEHRLVWLPDKIHTDLSPILVSIPNFREYCYLVDLSDR